MSFLPGDKDNSKRFFSQNNSLKLSPKQTLFKCSIHYTKVPRQERAWKIPFFSVHRSAGLTLEASLGLTLFLLVAVSLGQLFLVMQLQLRIQKVLEQVGSEAAQYSYLNSQVSLWESESRLLAELEEYLLAELGEEALKLRFVDVMGREALENSVLTKGEESISFEQSDIFKTQHRLGIAVTYQIRLPVFLLGAGDVTLRQQCYRYAWLGDKKPSREVKEQEQMVYVTRDGVVYHLSLSCTHLKLSVRQVEMDQVSELRNENGACYYACELCEPAGNEATVFITKEGDRYHCDRDCGGIRRYITAIPIREAEGIRLCSRCEKMAQEAEGE